MKLELDCIRDILIALEETIRVDDSGALPFKSYSAKILKEHPRVSKYPAGQVMYTLRIMRDGGLVSFGFNDSAGHLAFETDLTSGITFAGHQYLAAIRDDTLWAKARKKLAEIGGSATTTFVTAVCEGLAKGVLEKIIP